MITLEELKEHLAINKTKLDDEVSNQPMLFFEVSEAYVEAAAERDACKEELTSIDATLDGEVRAALAKSEDKVTEAMVKNSVQSHSKHQDAFDTYMAAKTKADLLLALKEAFAQRNYMLKELAHLFVASYFEQTSIGTGALEKAKYNQRRNIMADARRERLKDE